MKLFTIQDTEPWAGHLGLFADRTELVYSPLDWQKAGLQQTTSGYGGKVVSFYKINYEGKLYRLYTTCFSNAASTWFTVRGQKIFIN